MVPGQAELPERLGLPERFRREWGHRAGLRAKLASVFSFGQGSLKGGMGPPCARRGCRKMWPVFPPFAKGT